MLNRKRRHKLRPSGFMGNQSRREFLSQTTIAIGAATIAQIGATARAEDEIIKPRRPWKKAFYGGVQAATLREQFQTLRDAGFDGIELNSPTKHDRNEVLVHLKATGLLCEGVVD